MSLEATGSDSASRWWRKRNLALEFLLVAMPKILNGLGLILINAIALHLLGPAGFGVFSICSMAILLADGILGSAFDMGVVRLVPTLHAGQPGRARSIESAALYTKFLIMTAISLLLIPAASPIATKVFGLPNSGRLVYLSCAAAIALLAFRSVQVHLQVTQRFAIYGAFDLMASLLRLGGVGLVGTLLEPNPAYLLMVLVAAPAIAFVAGIATVGRSLLRVEPGILSESAELMSVVKWTLVTFCVTTVAAKIDLMLLSTWSTMESVGIFSAGQLLTMIPELLGMYLAVVVSPRIMPAIRDGTFGAMFRRFQTAAVVVAVVALVLGLASLGVIREYFLPDEYRRSAKILAILLPGALFSMVNFPLVVPTLMFVRPSALFKIELTLLPPLIILYYLGINHYGAEGAAVVTTCGRTLKAVVQSIAAWRCCTASREFE